MSSWISRHRRTAMMVYSLDDKAYKFAEYVHRDQKRKWTNEPYFHHLLEVAKMVRETGCSQEAIAAAYLHDSVEDCEVSVDLIDRLFGKVVADKVYLLTEQRPAGMNRSARKKYYAEQLKDADPETQTIKLADMISNVPSIIKHDPSFATVYVREKKELLEVALFEGDSTLRAKINQILKDFEFKKIMRVE